MHIGPGRIFKSCRPAMGKGGIEEALKCRTALFNSWMRDRIVARSFWYTPFRVWGVATIVLIPS